MKKSVIMKNKEKKFRLSFYLVVVLGLIVGLIKLLDLSILNFNSFNNSDFFSIAVALGFALESANSLFQHERLSITYKKSANDLTESLNKIDDMIMIFKQMKMYSLNLLKTLKTESQMNISLGL